MTPILFDVDVTFIGKFESNTIIYNHNKPYLTVKDMLQVTKGSEEEIKNVEIDWEGGVKYIQIEFGGKINGERDDHIKAAIRYGMPRKMAINYIDSWF